MAEATLEVLVRAKDEATKTLQNVNNSISGMSKQLKIAGAALMGVGATIEATLGICVKAAAEEEAGIVKLSTAMRNVGISYDAVRDSLEAWIDAEQQKTAIADTEQRESLATLILATSDLAEAQDLLTLAMDMARGMGEDLSSATSKIGMALAGNWGMLQRYIPVLAECSTEEEKWLKLREMFTGQAEEYGKTVAGQFELLKNNIGDVKEAIGSVLLPVVEKLVGWIQNFVTWLKNLNPQVVQASVFAIAAAGAISIFAGALLLLLGFLPSIFSGLTAVGISVTTTGTRATGAAVGVRIFGLALWQVALYAGMLTAGISLLVGGLAALYMNTQTAKQTQEAYTDAVQYANQVTATYGNTIDDTATSLSNYSDATREATVATQHLTENIDILQASALPADITQQQMRYDLMNVAAASNAVGIAYQALKVDVNELTKATNGLTEAQKRLMSYASQFPGGMTMEQLAAFSGGGGGSYTFYGIGIEKAKARIAALVAEGLSEEEAKEEVSAETKEEAGYEKGGIIPYTGYHYLHKYETVLPAGAEIVLHSHLYLDGRELTEVVSKHIVNEMKLQGGL